jgi:hypothetical protein
MLANRTLDPTLVRLRPWTCTHSAVRLAVVTGRWTVRPDDLVGLSRPSRGGPPSSIPDVPFQIPVPLSHGS